MLAAVWRGGPALELERVPVPEAGPGELLLRVLACGICPTDLKKIAFGLVDPPAVFGHETVGEVVAAGEGVEEYLGELVAVYHHVPCRSCRFCQLKLYSQCETYKKTGTVSAFQPRGGGWAEYVRVTDWIVAGGGVVPLPRGTDPELGTLMEPLNTCLKCVRQLPAGTESLVIAGQGPVGLTLLLLAREAGLQVAAIEPRPPRARLSRELGAEEVLTPREDLASQLRRLFPPQGPDGAISTVEESSTVRQVLSGLRPGGTLILFAHTKKNTELSLDGGDIGRDEKKLLGSYSSDIDLNEEVLELLLRPDLPWRRLLTHSFPLWDINQALDLARKGEGDSLKVVIRP